MADALISPPVGIGFWAISGALAVRSAARMEADASRAPMMGVIGAFVFAAQMINFSIPGTGSSGHLGGGMLLSILLGPGPAFITIAGVLTIQCLLFADGGLLALGCNIFNLGAYPCFVGLPLYRLIAGKGESRARNAAAIMAACIVSLELGALSVVVQAVLSGISDLPFSKFFALMLGIHFPIAIVEGLVTIAVVGFITRLRPAAILEATGGPPLLKSGILAVLLCVALAVGGVLAWYASESPDGLEWSLSRATGKEEIEAKGLAETAAEIQSKIAILPDYSLSGAEEGAAGDPRIGTSLSGVIGSIATLAAVSVFAASVGAMRRRKSQAAQSSP